MIQRKQTIFLLLALAAMIVCLCLPIGRVDAKALGSGLVWYNIGTYASTGIHFQPLLFIDLVVASSLTLIDIFLFNKRKLQAQLCVVGILLCIVWYGYYIFNACAVYGSLDGFHIGFAACLPFVAIVLLFLARRGIKADEALIKSMDRIR